MAFPKILLGVPLVVAGMYLPAATSLAHRPAESIGMTHEGFATKVAHVHVGQRLTFVNDSYFIHIIGPGSGGHLEPVGKEPVDARLLVQQNETYTTGSWNTAGTYSITCSVHPEMTVKIIVAK